METLLQKCHAAKDESGHWYVIPNDLSDEFGRLQELSENGNNDAEKEFIDKFSKYMTGGDLNNVQLWAKL